jgi:hypothetical protein
MDAHEPAHPDVSSVVLTGETRIRDVRSHEVRSADEWIDRSMDREGRERQECVDELMNAIARGDLVLES